MRQTDLERLADLEANNTFQHRTLQAIRLVAAKAPPEESRRALRAIDALANEALAQANEDEHPASESVQVRSRTGSAPADPGRGARLRLRSRASSSRLGALSQT